MIEVPPDATPFVSHGKRYYLHLGLKELRGLQRKWGLQREPGDTEQQYELKTLAFEIQLQSTEREDHRDILHAALTDWAVATGYELTSDEAMRIFEGARMPFEGEAPPADRFRALLEQLNEDSSGEGFFDEPAGEEPDDVGPKGFDPERLVAEGLRWGLSLDEAWRISPRSLRLYCSAKVEAWKDQLRIATQAAWTGQIFHGRLMSNQGLSTSALDEMLPKRRMTMAERRAIHQSKMSAKVSAINAVMLARKEKAEAEANV